MSLPPLPVEYEDPYFEKRRAFDLAVASILEGRLSSEGIIALVDGRVTPAAQNAASAYLASNPGVIDAAEQAVDEVIASRPILEGGETNATEIIFAVVDDEGRRTQFELGPDGRLTPYARALLIDTVGADIAALAGIQTQDEGITGLAFVVVDDEGRRTELEIGRDGRFTQRVVDSIGERLQVSPTPGLYRASYSEETFPIASGPDMFVAGSSSAAGSGGGGTSVQSIIAAATGRTVRTLGVGGETSKEVSARVGGDPALVTVVGESIPTSGGVAVTLANAAGQSVNILNGQGSAGINPVEIAGVLGTLSRVDSVFTFTPTTPPVAPVVVRYPVPLVTEAMRNRRGDLGMYWNGLNDSIPSTNPEPTWDLIFDRTDADIQLTTSLDKRFLVLSRWAQDAATLAYHEDQGRRRYGRRFVNAREFLSRYGLMLAGITPTSQDVADMAAGRVPVSLKSDASHLNPQGYTLLGNYVLERLDEMGWV